MTERPDSWITVEDGPETEIKEKGSRFLAQLFHAPDEAAADAALESIRRRHHAATHHCSARRLGEPAALTQRSDDDGEPSGTAGAPRLAVLAGADLFGVLAVVTRYYGGTRLGTGGLARAYSDAVKQALSETHRRTVWREAVVTVTCGWGDVGAVEAVLAREGDEVRGCERDFGDAAVFRVTLLASRAEGLVQKVREATGARAVSTATEDRPA
jgi:uncharacterized YigZ family protein